MSNPGQVAQVKALFEEHQVDRVKIAGVDIDGVLRGKYVSLDKFWSIVNGGMGFCDVIFGWDVADELYDRETVTGWATGYPDATAFIDLDTFRMIPWEPDTASFLLDFRDHDGTPNPVSPRQVLQRVIDKAKGMGLRPVCSVEYEFFIYRETAWSLAEKGYKDPKPLDPGMFGYSWLRTSQSSELTHDLLDLLEEFGTPIEGFHTETGPGVFEAALCYDDALVAADRGVLFKSAVKEICARHECTASFMAKPSATLPGCSGHMHQSMWDLDRKTNVFHDDGAEHGASKKLTQYVAGQLELMPAMLSLIAPNVNSYKRLVPGLWAPTAATWGWENRTCALRVIPGGKNSTRVEYRLSGADINPYLAFAASVASGLYGIAKELEPTPAIVGNAYEADAVQLPRSLGEAAEALSKSEVAKELLGETFVDHYVLSRDFEVRQSQKAVTDWELARYFEIV